MKHLRPTLLLSSVTILTLATGCKFDAKPFQTALPTSSGSSSLGSIVPTPTPTPVATVTPSPTVTPTPTPVATMTPRPTATPTPSPTPTPVATPTPTPVASNKIIIGTNGHDGVQAYYPLSQAEERFKVLDKYNLRSYRFDLMVGNNGVLDTLVPLAKKYNITLRPMIYPTTQAATYAFVKRYASAIKIWEIGNEQDYDRAGAQTRINAMVATYKGVKQASDELGANLKTTINIMACNSDDVSATARCPRDKNGALWFLDMAKASGFNFDYISFHYYPGYGDKGYWMDMYLSQAKVAAKKYNTKVFFNEMNCAAIYSGNTDGGYAGDKNCYDSVAQILTEIQTKYADVFAEVNLYELIDEPDHSLPHERHFGIMYNLSTPKKLIELASEFSKK